MRKQELIHLHGLLLEVQKHCTPEADLSVYESLGIGPTSIYRHKNEHRKAVFALMEAIMDDLYHEQTPVVSPPSA